tara:strand:- start:45 stop:512 length:468 start_codon:yes stop_codon:yes gene_type:complete
MRADSMNESSGRYGGVAKDVVFVPDAATYTVQTVDSGKIHVMPDLTADCVLTMPAEARGLSYEFWYGGTAADAQDWQFDTGSNTNYYVGGLVIHDTDAGGDDTAVIDSNGSSNSKVSVLTPIAGTTVKMVCDGVVWYLNGTVIGATDTAVVFADQ